MEIDLINNLHNIVLEFIRKYGLKFPVINMIIGGGFSLMKHGSSWETKDIDARFVYTNQMEYYKKDFETQDSYNERVTELIKIVILYRCYFIYHFVTYFNNNLNTFNLPNIVKYHSSISQRLQNRGIGKTGSNINIYDSMGGSYLALKSGGDYYNFDLDTILSRGSNILQLFFLQFENDEIIENPLMDMAIYYFAPDETLYNWDFIFGNRADMFLPYNVIDDVKYTELGYEIYNTLVLKFHANTDGKKEKYKTKVKEMLRILDCFFAQLVIEHQIGGMENNITQINNDTENKINNNTENKIKNDIENTIKNITIDFDLMNKIIVGDVTNIQRSLE